MILITGATGNVGKAILTNLTQQKIKVKAMHYRLDGMHNTEYVEWVQGDFTQPDTLRQAMQGVSKLVIISPAHPNMVQHQTNILNAAQQAGVTHIVKLSSLGTAPNAGNQLARTHAAIEALIVASGIAHTFVRPNIFMQTTIMEKPGRLLISPGAGSAKISFIDVTDIAAVMAQAVVSDAYLNQNLDITGAQALSYSDIAQHLSRKLNRKIWHISMPQWLARKGMKKAGIAPWLAQGYLELFADYQKGNGAKITPTVADVTGKAPVSYDDFASEKLKTFD